MEADILLTLDNDKLENLPHLPVLLTVIFSISSWGEMVKTSEEF